LDFIVHMRTCIDKLMFRFIQAQIHHSIRESKIANSIMSREL
jgi:hypothetical protein